MEPLVSPEGQRGTVIKFLSRRGNTRSLVLTCLILLLLTNSEIVDKNVPIVLYIIISTTPNRTYRPALFIKLRLEEARDCIYRLPPPGNGRGPRRKHNLLQTTLDNHFNLAPDRPTNLQSLKLFTLERKKLI